MKYSIRNFLLVFVLSLIIFIAAAFYCINYVEGFMGEMFGEVKPIETLPSPETFEGNDNKETGSHGAEKKDIVSFLLIGKDETEGHADAIMLVKADKNSKKIIMTSIPSDMKIFYDGEYKKLFLSLRGHDEEFLCGKIRALTGVNVDFYVSMETEGFCDLINALGGISYYVHQDMYYYDPSQALEIDLKRGQQLLDGEKALDMLRFRGYAMGDTARTSVQRKFLAEFIKTFLKPENATKLPQMIEIIYESIDTSFNAETLIANSDIIFSLSQYTVEDITYPGKMVTEDGDTFFSPDVEKALDVFREYR